MDTDPTAENEGGPFARHALSFGAVADLYDAARPGYPARLFAHIAHETPGPRILEVGAGTGKATAGLIAAGLDVTAVEPDPDMAGVLQRAAHEIGAAAAVRVVVSGFEQFADTAQEQFDALVSAQAWHWTKGEGRMRRAARLLAPGGFLGLVWNTGAFEQPGVFEAIGAVYDEFGLFGEHRPREPIGSAQAVAVMQDPTTWPADEIAADPDFEYLGSDFFPWRQDYSAADLVALLESTSYYQVLEQETRSRLLDRISGLIRDEFSDLVTLAWSTQCYNARRRG